MNSIDYLDIANIKTLNTDSINICQESNLFKL
jgi:hypothetical protein